MGNSDKLTRRLHNRIGRAIKDFDLIEEGDHVLVCLSGGKDSYTLLSLLMELSEHSPVAFRLTAFHLDQRQPGYPSGIMEDFLASRKVAYRICEEDTYSVVKEKIPEGATPCSLCSRLRRGLIYAAAEELGCNKIALGHHRDDSIETLLLNLFHTGQIQAMPARYTTDDGRFDVIRPLLYTAEEDIAAYAERAGFPIIPCNLCGSVEGRRKYIKAMLHQLEQTIPHVRTSLLAAMGNVRSSHLLDRNLLARLKQNDAPSQEDGASVSVKRMGGCGSDEALF
ncbi:MAG: tRNA 2-thiocytidine(32) synthetase TtcA [Bradymonadaceae bacterium]|nr:tRNA 2-thiocytidine(32) synthetase TtcA [Lujinxingiaceae bacterium]